MPILTLGSTAVGWLGWPLPRQGFGPVARLLSLLGLLVKLYRAHFLLHFSTGPSDLLGGWKRHVFIWGPSGDNAEHVKPTS